MKRADGFTLIELLIGASMIGVLAAVGIFSLLPTVYRVQAENDATSASAIVRFAVAETRRRNSSISLTISGKTLVAKSGTTVIRKEDLTIAPVVACKGGICPSGSVFSFTAPYGRNSTDFKLSFTRGTATRTLWVRGPNSMVNIQ